MNTKWPTVPLKKVLKPVSRPESVDPGKMYHILGAHWYAQGLYTKYVMKGTQIRASKIYRIEKGDFVYNRLFAWKGSFAVAIDENDGCYVSNEFPSFAIDNNILDSKYLWRIFSLASIWDDALGLSTGGTPTSRNRLKQEKLLAMNISLPPLDEQRRIVARIEELAAWIEEARELRRRAAEETEALLKSSRNAIVEALRKHYPDTRLGNVCQKITDGPHVSPSYVSKGIPFISVRNISESGLDFSTAKYVSEADHRIFSQKAKVERGDVLYTKGGTTGVAHRVDTDKEFSIWVHVALLKLDKDKVRDGFVEHMLNAPSSKAQALEYTHGSSNKDLGLTRMCNILFPVPPISDQGRIVDYLDRLQSKLDALKRHQEETAAELYALLPAVLERAFRGEL